MENEDLRDPIGKVPGIWGDSSECGILGYGVEVGSSDTIIIARAFKWV